MNLLRKNKTVLTLKNSDREVHITLTDLEPDIHSLMQYGVKPLIIAAGFHPENVKEYIEDA